MAEIARIVRRDPLSNFRNVAPKGGTAFRAMADMAQQAYKALEPAAIQQMEQKAQQNFSELARRHMGQNRPMSLAATSTSGSLRGGTALDGGLPASLIRSESGGNFRAQNAVRGSGGVGHFGRGQFSRGRLNDAMSAGIIPRGTTPEQFMADEDMQVRVENWHMNDIMSRVSSSGLDRFIGTEINGVEVTPSGMLAAAHLGGFGGLRRFLETGGRHNPSDANGTSLADYMRAHAGPLGELTATVSSSGKAAPALSEPEVVPPMTMVRTEEGALEPRLYSPLSGPILQAHNAAAQVAYQSEVLNQASMDIMELSRQHPLDPSAFRAAAEDYMDGVLDSAPEMFRADLQASLGREVMRRFAGMTEERHRDIRQRAANSSQALMERHQAAYADALAAGSAEDAEEALAELQSTLMARESLPGVAWTPEQSENAIMRAEEMADRLRERRANEVRSEFRGALTTIRDLARSGYTAEDESILENPMVRDLLPDLFDEAAAMVSLRDSLPSFWQAPPEERQAVIQEELDRPKSGAWETRIADAMQAADRAISRAWDEDPVQAAQQSMPDRLPPEIPPFEHPGFPDAIAAREEWALSVAEDGWTDVPVLFSAAELEEFGALAKHEDAAVRGLFAAQVSQAGSDLAVEQIGLDPVLALAGSLSARGAPADVVVEAASGMAHLAAGTVNSPPVSERRAALWDVTGDALSRVGGYEGAGENIMKLANALYAAEAVKMGLTEPDEDLMQTSVQRALGQQETPRGPTGGIQEVMGRKTLLPVGVRADQAERALQRAFGFRPPAAAEGRTIGSAFGRETLNTLQQMIPGVGMSAVDRRSREPVFGPDNLDSRTLIEAFGGVPQWGAQPATDFFEDGTYSLSDLSLSVIGSTGEGNPVYMVSMTSGEVQMPLQLPGGTIATLDLMDLIERAR